MNYTSGPETASSLSTCTAQLSDASTCGKPSVDGITFPICERHVLNAYRWVTLHMESLADDPLFQWKFRMDSLDAEHARDRRRRAGRSEVVYYVQVGPHIKIGYTSALAQRMQSYPLNRRLLAVEAGDYSLEQQRHNEFRHLLDLGKEWFRPGPELLVHINTLRLGSGASPIKIQQ